MVSQLKRVGKVGDFFNFMCVTYWDIKIRLNKFHPMLFSINLCTLSISQNMYAVKFECSGLNLFLIMIIVLFLHCILSARLSDLPFRLEYLPGRLEESSNKGLKFKQKY